ncbi:MAG TPA: TonB family protein [Thermoanaerobaculia bacterium]|jgi:TonB family protein
MFETSVVRAQAAVAPRRVGLLTASFAVHSCAIVAVVVASITSVEFPPDAPRQSEIFRLSAPVSLPPKLGTPDGGGPKPQPKPAVTAPKPDAPRELTAPREIPAEIVPAEASTTNTSTDAGPAEGSGNPGAKGSPDGVEGGFEESSGPGIIQGEGSEQPKDVIYHVGAEVSAPRVLRRVDPVYPQIFIRAGVSATVTIRFIIGKQGEVRDAQIIRSSHPPFNQSVLDAVARWEFAPGTMRGTPVDTYYELTVKFSAVR